MCNIVIGQLHTKRSPPNKVSCHLSTCEEITVLLRELHTFCFLCFMIILSGIDGMLA